MSGEKAPIKLMSLEDFNAILSNVDVDEIPLFRLWAFGEPMLHPKLPEMLEISRRQAFRIGRIEISTNGQYRRFGHLKEVLKTKQVDQFVVSCDGDGTPEDYERLRPPSKWDVLLGFLAKAREYRDRYSPTTRLMTRTICNDLAAQARWRHVLAPFGFAPEFRTWIILPGSSENPSGHAPRVRNECCQELIFDNLYCDHDGTLLPCCLHPRAFELGDLRGTPWSELWFGEKKVDVMFELMWTRKAMAICGQCEQQSAAIGVRYLRQLAARHVRHRRRILRAAGSRLLRAFFP